MTPSQCMKIIKEFKFSLMNTREVMGLTRETYPEWAVNSWTPRKEQAFGDTPEEAVDNLLIKLDMK